MIEKLGIKKIRREPHGRLMSVVLTDQLEELEKQSDEMLEALIDAVQRFYDYEMMVDGDAPPYHRDAMNKYLSAIEKATGKTWEEIKEIING